MLAKGKREMVLLVACLLFFLFFFLHFHPSKSYDWTLRPPYSGTLGRTYENLLEQHMLSKPIGAQSGPTGSIGFPTYIIENLIPCNLGS